MLVISKAGLLFIFSSFFSPCVSYLMLNKPAAVGCLLKMPNVGAKRDDSSFYYALAFTSGLETTGISYFLFTTVGENKLEFIG